MARIRRPLRAMDPYERREQAYRQGRRMVQKVPGPYRIPGILVYTRRRRNPTQVPNGRFAALYPTVPVRLPLREAHLHDQFNHAGARQMGRQSRQPNPSSLASVVGASPFMGKLLSFRPDPMLRREILPIPHQQNQRHGLQLARLDRVPSPRLFSQSGRLKANRLWKSGRKSMTRL